MTTGKIIKLGDNVNTDSIYPAKFLSFTEPEEMAKYAFKGLGEEFPGALDGVSVVVAGRNFGCGSSREQAATCLKYAGIAAVVAKGFSRIFYRNAINWGLPAVQCADAVDNIENNAVISLDFENSKIVTEKGTFAFNPYPPMVLGILEAGGLIEYARKKIETRPNPCP